MTSDVIDARPWPRQDRREGPAQRRLASEEAVMSTYAIAHVRKASFGPPIIEYLQRIDATLEPFGGRFLVHGGKAEAVEGQWSGDLIIIEFPDRAHAWRWYQSAAYQAILPLRRENTEGEVIFIDTVAAGHRSTDLLSA
jgi:uncharacterized protein (DUF1330 family)